MECARPYGRLGAMFQTGDVWLEDSRFRDPTVARLDIEPWNFLVEFFTSSGWWEHIWTVRESTGPSPKFLPPGRRRISFHLDRTCPSIVR